MDIRLQLMDLQDKLEDVIQDVMKKEVSNAIIDEAKHQVESMVYSYIPKQYERTETLKHSWALESISSGVIIRNTMTDNGKHIASVVETGDGYDYTGYGYEYEQPRPFIQTTVNKMLSSGEHIEAFKQGLKRKGIKTR